MGDAIKLGIIICDRVLDLCRVQMPAGAPQPRGSVCPHQGKEVELVGFATCNGCPGGNIDTQEMKKNGAEVVHLATGMIVGYPPCPRISYFKKFLRESLWT